VRGNVAAHAAKPFAKNLNHHRRLILLFVTRAGKFLVDGWRRRR
jgi:hypothetical protein